MEEHDLNVYVHNTHVLNSKYYDLNEGLHLITRLDCTERMEGHIQETGGALGENIISTLK